MARQQQYKICWCHVHGCCRGHSQDPLTNVSISGVLLKPSTHARHQRDEELLQQHRQSVENEGVENRILLASLKTLQLDATVVSRTNLSTILDTASMDVECGGLSVDHSIVINTLQAPQLVTSRTDSSTVPSVPININLSIDHPANTNTLSMFTLMCHRDNAPMDVEYTGGPSVDLTVLNALVDVNLSVDRPADANTLSRSSSSSGPSVDLTVLNAPVGVNLSVGHPTNTNTLSRSSASSGLSIDLTMLNAPVDVNLSVNHPTNANTLLRSVLVHYHKLFHGHQIVFESQPKAANDPPPALHQRHCSAFLTHQEAIMSLIRLVDGVYPQDSMDLDVRESQRCLSQELDSYFDAQWTKLKGEQGLQSFSGSLNLMSDLSYSTELHIGFLDHLKTASAPVLACITVVVTLHLLSNMPRNASNFLLDAVQLIVLSACEWAMTSLGGNIPLPLFHDSLQFQSWPQDLRSAICTLNLDPELNIYACCPSCCALYLYKYQAQTLDIPEQCTARQTTGSPICNTPLLYCSSSSTGDSVPHQTFNYQPLKSWLACLLS
ncbi:hypothetical protein BKA82DRAFT_4020058 [Pisolithus tinctorius]|nr:hypothetical protein BKA82DRAFT_4020058 [Pisolithus tinctorius]